MKAIIVAGGTGGHIYPALAILNKIKDNMYVIAMDLQGDMKTSEQFAKQLSQLALSGDSNVAFIIGGFIFLQIRNRKK